LLLARKRHHRPGPRPWTRVVVALLAATVLTTGVASGLVGIGGASLVNVLAAGLDDPMELERLDFAQPTIVYDRTGTVELARFQQEARRVVGYEEIPPLVLDTTTTAEDRTFWENKGFDPAAIASAVAGNLSGETDRGASTITQQLIRARLLPDEVTAPGADRYARKVLEIIQAARVTQAFPDERGKERIIAAYLNQIYYGHQAYGVAAAAQVYFGLDNLADLTMAQAAQLAALPQAPSVLDLYRYAAPDEAGQLVVDPTSPPVLRRNWILQNLATSRWTHPTPAQVEAALREPVVLAGEPSTRMLAPHFSWQVRRQLENLLGGSEVVETGGYKVITSLDWNAQQLAERWTTASLIAPNLPRSQSDELLAALEIPSADRRWINALRGKDLHNGALVAMDYRTGDVLAYVGSAGYDRGDLASAKFSPKFDAAGDGLRQPGSAFKPIVYATAFERNALTPGSLLLDITTMFDQKSKWAPRDADQLERGPVLVRDALQYSLNIPAIRAYHRVGGAAVADMTEALGIRMQGGRKLLLEAGLAAAIGTVEVRPLDLLAAYGAIANGGMLTRPRLILSVTGPDGELDYEAPVSNGHPAMSPQTAFLVTDILAGNTDPRQNPIWADVLEIRNGPKGARRPAAVKTGTANEAKDLATYGFLAPPADPASPAIAVGIWMGNSDHSSPQTSRPATSLTAAAPLWRAFVRDLSSGMPVANFGQPDGVTQDTIDSWSGGKPGSWTRDTKREWFKEGTQPSADGALDQAGLLYASECGRWRVDPRKAEVGPSHWMPDVADWLRRARRGTGVNGEHHSRTAYFWGRSGWGGALAGEPCAPIEQVVDELGKGRGRDDNGGGSGGGGGSDDESGETSDPSPAASLSPPGRP
jgi:membrane peptidoglycan carboxypeptidase